jgi:hypothetical protein
VADFVFAVMSFDGLLPAPGDSFIIHVNIYGSTHSSTKMKVAPGTAAGNICSSICDKLGIPIYDVPFYSLIAVFVYTDRENPVHRLKTLKATDILFDVIRKKELKSGKSMYLTKWLVVMLSVNLRIEL